MCACSFFIEKNLYLYKSRTSNDNNYQICKNIDNLEKLGHNRTSIEKV